MRKFEENLKQRAHLVKIKQAKPTMTSSTKVTSKSNNSRTTAQAQLLIQLYQKKNYDSIPAFKLLRTAGLQQYTKAFIQRGYGINLGRLALVAGDDRKKFYQEVKILPGHAAKMDKIIDSLAKTSYCPSQSNIQENFSTSQQQNRPKMFIKKDPIYEKQLERVLNQYTPVSDNKNKTFVNKPLQKKVTTNLPPIQPSPLGKQTKTKYQQKSIDFKKKIENSTKPTVKRSILQNTKLSSKPSLKTQERPMSAKKVMEINLQIDKIRSASRSFDGANMSSTIANIDIQQLVYAFSGYIVSNVKVLSEPKSEINEPQNNEQTNNEDIEDEVGQILKQSFLHPMYREDVDQQIQCEEALSQGQRDQQEQQQVTLGQKMMQSSFLGGQSVDFGVKGTWDIFNEPSPTLLDYLKPTIDSVSNFIKNIVLTAKMERQIPIMAAAYLQNFLSKANLVLTSLNYKRLLVINLLIASKVWDDQSFQTPSFSKTFPQYSTILLNEMQKQIVKTLDYALKIDKKQYTRIYFTLRSHAKDHARSYQNRKLSLRRIRQLQCGKKRQFKSMFMTKRNSH